MAYPRLSRLLLVVALVAAAPAAMAMGRDEAAALVRQQTGGRVLSVVREERGGEPVFVVKVLTRSGEVRIVVVDARSGAMR
jgi:uncharacterized membrane protein YkoI